MTRRQLYFVIILSLLFTLHPSLSSAIPRSGFYEGPYLTLSGGLMQFDWDVNRRTRVEEGFPWEPIIGLSFGWNVLDWFAPELFFRYTTNKNDSRREHIVGANIGLAFTYLNKHLLDFKKWRILPFIKPGMAAQVASLPGDTNSTDNRITTKGIGGSISGGVRFLFNEYLYWGFEIQNEWILQESQSQTLNPGGVTQIYEGGVKSQLEAFTMVGVHF